MTKEQEMLIAGILKDIVIACYNTMGQEWCKEMIDRINQIKSAGKP